MRSDSSLHATGTPWALRDHAVSRPSERAVALLRNATVAVGLPWHLHTMENAKLFAIFSSILVRSHGTLRNFKSPCQCRGIAVECDRGFSYTSFMLISFTMLIIPWWPFLSFCCYTGYFRLPRLWESEHQQACLCLEFSWSPSVSNRNLVNVML